MFSLGYWVLMFLGIVIWPEAALCFFLITQGYWVLGIVAILTSFGSGKTLIRDRFWKKP